MPSREALLVNIRPEPVMMAPVQRRHWLWRPRQLGLAVLLLLLLLGQVVWLQFDSLSRKEPWRGALQQLCPWIGCSLPVLVDKNRITVGNLSIRKDDRTSDVLVMDMILVNTAAFEQPFPALDVLFSNIDQEPVANRRFVPTDYLDGELAGLALMPRNQPVHITLELVDPGEEAVNYKVEPH